MLLMVSSQVFFAVMRANLAPGGRVLDVEHGHRLRCLITTKRVGWRLEVLAFLEGHVCGFDVTIPIDDHVTMLIAPRILYRLSSRHPCRRVLAS